MHFVLGILLMVQLSLPPGAKLPNVMSASFTPAAPVMAGRKADIVVSFSVLKGYAIDRDPQIRLKLTEVPAGLKLAKSEFVAPSEDPKSKDAYFVDLPAIHVQATAAKAGVYDVSGKLTYFFCNKASGYCAKQTVDVKLHLQAK